MHSADVHDGEPGLQGGASRKHIPHNATRADPGQLAIFKFALRHYEMNDMSQRNIVLLVIHFDACGPSSRA